MAEVKEGIWYSTEHEWLSVEDNVAKVGISDYAQAALGDVTYVELPLEGLIVKTGNIISNIESVKAASDVYSPVVGTVSIVNIELEDNPELVNSSPYDNGWICKVDLADTPDTSELMDAKSYSEYLQTL